MKTEVLKQRIEELEKMKENLLAQVNACNGAISENKRMIAELEKIEEDKE